MVALTPEELAFRAQRRTAVARSPELGGLDAVAVARLPSAAGTDRERWRLDLDFVPGPPGRPAILPGIGPSAVRITLDGVADPSLRVEAVTYPETPGGPLAVEVSRRGAAVPGGGTVADLAVYTLELVGIGRLDPFFTRASFRFVPGRPGEVLTRPAPPAVEPGAPVDVDYLAKDYASFRTLMLERMAVLAPSWTERNPADLGVALIELLAYAGDQLSYRQDAVATEGYLRTARRRLSIRRHARLLGYRLHEGCNARVWALIEVDEPLRLPARTRLLTTVEAPPGGESAAAAGDAEDEAPEGGAARRRLLPPVLVEPSQTFDEALAQGVRVFETVYPCELVRERNRMPVYAWGADDFQLAEGATEAALEGDFEALLAPGEVIVLRQVRGGRTGRAGDADPHRRHAVRITACRADRDPLADRAITRIGWSEEDALPFALPVAARLGSRTVTGLTAAFGNVVLADHGRTVEPEELPAVPDDGGYRPQLRRPGISYRVPPPADPAALGSARAALGQEPVEALPEVALYSYPEHSLIPPAERRPPRGERWLPRHTLLYSGRFASDFCLEVDSGGEARARFGDGRLGKRPPPRTRVWAEYRVGNGAEGNLGPHSLGHLVLTRGAVDADPVPDPKDPRPAGDAGADAREAWYARRLLALGGRVRRVDNPLPASGGTEPESQEAARVNAPEAFRAQQRCVTAADYVEIAERHRDVLRAACRLEWTGSWETAFLYLQRPGGRPVTEELRRRVRAWMEPYLLAGTGLEIRPPRWVPLHVRLRVRLEPDRFRERLRQELERVFDGSPGGFFDPDRFGFGRPVYLSEVVAAATAVEGVAAVEVLEFHRWGEPPGDEIERGRVEVGPLEIARVRSDPNAPQLGVVDFVLEGGR